MKVTATVGEILNHHPSVARRHENGDGLLAAARELGDSVSFELSAAPRRLAECDRDREHEVDAAVYALHEAEAAFLRAHAETEVSL